MSGRHLFHPTYRIIGADLFSDIGNQFIALSLFNILVFKGENALFNIVMICVIHQLPSIFLSPLAGLLIDRMGAGKWLILVNLSKCFLVGMFAVTISTWTIFPVYLCFIVASLFFSIGRLSLVPLLVTRNKLISFNALNERIAISGGILSPWLIGIILEKTSQTVALMVPCLLFAISIFLIPKVPGQDNHSPPSSSRHLKKQSVNTLFSIYKKPFLENDTLRIYFFMLGFILLGGGVLNMGLPLLFKTHLNGSIAKWGIIMSAFQAGAFLSTILLPLCAKILKRGAILPVSFLAFGGAMFILPYMTSYFQIAALMAFFGFGFTMLHIFWESLIQQNSPRHLIGKTMSLLSSYKGLCYLSTILAGALLSTVWGAESFLMVGSLVVASGFFMVRRQ